MNVESYFLLVTLKSKIQTMFQKRVSLKSEITRPKTVQWFVISVLPYTMLVAAFIFYPPS